MPVLEVTVIIGCKNSCVYCPQAKFIAAYKARSNIFHMSFDTFKHCIDKIPPDVFIEFAGMSEPWLNSDCTRMLLYSHQKGHKIRVYTTLLGMRQADIDLIKTVPFDTFKVHLPSCEGYEHIKVDNNYIDVLKRISESGIKIEYRIHGKAADNEVRKLIKNIKKGKLHDRSGNIAIKGEPPAGRRRGVIGCNRIDHNILLPNGDVLLCCNDYGMRHVLENLLSSDYASLFESNEFLKIKKGFKDESIDILCRYCYGSAYNIDFKAIFYNKLLLPKLRAKIKGFIWRSSKIKEQKTKINNFSEG